MKEIIILKSGYNQYHADYKSSNLLEHINNGSPRIFWDKNSIIDNLKFDKLQELANAHGWNIRIAEGSICVD